MAQVFLVQIFYILKSSDPLQISAVRPLSSQCGNKFAVKLLFISAVLQKTALKNSVVRVGKRVGYIMRQFSEPIVISDPQLIFRLRGFEKFSHHRQNILIVMSVKFFSLRDTVQISKRLSVGLQTAQDKHPPIKK